MEEIKELDALDFDEIDKQLDDEINNQLKELDDLKMDYKEIGNPKKLTDSISQIVWEQFIIQLAGKAGQDFIKENNNLNLSLKKADHILTETGFINEKYPIHNSAKIDDYKARHDAYTSKFKVDENGNIATHQTRMGTEEISLAKGARKIFDENRPTGSKIRNTSMDHTVSAGEILRDSKAGAFLNESEKVQFANSEDNLYEMDRDWNASKADMSTSDWLDNPNSNGQKPKDIFDMSDKDEQELRNKDAQAREKWEEVKNEGEQRAIAEGNASRRAEALRAAGITTQAIAVALLAKLTRTVFQELIKWLSEKDRKPRTLIEHFEKAVHDFLIDFKGNVLLSVDVGATVILTQLFGEIIPMIRKALLFVKIGGETVYKVAKYLKDPVNQDKETSVKILEIGKIVTIGFTTADAIGLSMGITAVLEYYVPALAVQIPLLGSPASLLGIFFGGLTAGICGAIVLHSIDGALEGKLLSENVAKQLVIQGDVLALQDTQFSLYESYVADSAQKAAQNIKVDMIEAVEEMNEKKKSLEEKRTSQNEEKFNDISNMIDDLD